MYEVLPYLLNTPWRCIVRGERAVLRLIWRMIGYLLWPPLSPNRTPEICAEEKKDVGCIVLVWCSGIANMKRAARNRNAVIHHVAILSGESGKPIWVIKQLNPGIGAYAACIAKIQRQTDILRIFIGNHNAVWLAVKLRPKEDNNIKSDL